MTALRAMMMMAVVAATAGCAIVTKADVLKLGSIEVLPARPTYTGAVLSAPHGTGDTNTAEITQLLAQDLPFPRRSGFVLRIQKWYANVPIRRTACLKLCSILKCSPYGRVISTGHRGARVTLRARLAMP
jgi:hypothetical protein